MANTETKQLDNIIASRRALLMGGGAVALAAIAMPKTASAALAPASIGDTDILNFALNLEYLEAQFYYYAAFGVPITTAGNALITSAGGAAASTGIGIGPGTALTGGGTVSVKATSTKVPFTLNNVAAYAVETAVEEGKHVNFLRTALGSAAVAMPNIDLNGAFNTLATAAGIGATFDPFASDANFLIGAYIFEDVGVTAYKGAAPLFTTGMTGKTYLNAAAGILAVEAYHAGLVRTTINNLDPTGALGYIGLTQKVSTLRSNLSKAALSTVTVDDFPLTPGNATYSLEGTSVTGTSLVDADANVIAFSRNTTQVLNIVTGGGALTAGAKAAGVFFPNGMNGAIA